MPDGKLGKERFGMEETMSRELAKTYDPKGIEDRLYRKWLDKKYFHAEVDENTVHHRDPAPEYHGAAPHGTCP